MAYLESSKKPEKVKVIINEAIDLLVKMGIPVEDKTERSLERMAMALLAVAGVVNNWSEAKDNRFLKTRDIINFINLNFEEKISSGSYDNIRRNDLKMLVLAGLVLNSSDKPNAATNNPTRGYNIEPSFKELIISYHTKEWESKLSIYLSGTITLKEQLSRARNIEKVPVVLPNGIKLELSAGQHNLLQKLIIEEFLPRYGKGCQILYIGDTSDKLLYMDSKKLEKLKFFKLEHDELPDIVAFNQKKNWLYLIEAVHSSGSISELRMLELEALTKNCTAEIVYVTAFLNRAEFRKWSAVIAWETEVWIADNPDHLIHFNGEKFLGPYKIKK